MSTPPQSVEQKSKAAQAPRTKIDKNGQMIARGYTHEQIEQALVEKALAGGASRQAEAKLRAEGWTITSRTIDTWAERFSERYEAIYEREVDKIQKRVAMRAEEAAVEAIQATHEGIARSREVLGALAPKDVSGHARNMAVVAMGLNDKIIGPNRGRPTQRIEVIREPTAILSEISAMFPGVIDSTAIEITEAPPSPGTRETPDVEKAPSREPSPASEPEGSATP